MLSIFLFVVILSTYIWLSYEPQRTSDNHQRIDKGKLRVEIVDNRTPIPEQSESIAATEQLTTDTEAATESLPELKRPLPPDPELVEAARESAPKVDAAAGEAAQIPIEELAPEVTLAPAAEASPEEMPPITPVEEPQAEPAIATNEDLSPEEVEIEPVLTEEEAIALAVETALASDDTPDASPGSVPDLIRPHPPDPELVEAAIRDAEEKSEDFSPPEIVDT